MNANDVMTSDVKTCTTNDSLSRAAQLMWDHDCGCIPVIDDAGTAVGMITDRDICMAAYTQGRAMTEIPVWSAMSRHMYACSPNTTLERAQAMMRQHQVRRLPVLDATRRVVGILSLGDLARASMSSANGKPGVTAVAIDRTLAEVCQPRCATESATSVSA